MINARLTKGLIRRDNCGEAFRPVLYEKNVLKLHGDMYQWPGMKNYPYVIMNVKVAMEMELDFILYTLNDLMMLRKRLQSR